MSTISVDTITDRSASESVDAAYLVHGTVKMWVRAAADAVVTDSLNVSSSTDNGVGDYQYNLTNSFADANSYSVSCNVYSGGGRMHGTNTATASYVRGLFFTSAGAALDITNDVMAVGDLA